MKISAAIFLFHLILGVACHGTDPRLPKFEVTVQYFNPDGKDIDLTYAAKGSLIGSKWILTVACIFYHSSHLTEEFIIADDKYTNKSGFLMEYATIKNYYILDPLKDPTDNPVSHSLALVEITAQLRSVLPIDIFRGDTSFMKDTPVQRDQWHRFGSIMNKFVKWSSEIVDLNSGRNPSSLGTGVVVADEGKDKLCGILGSSGTPLKIEEHIPFIDLMLKKTSTNDDTGVDYGLKTSTFQAAIFYDDDGYDGDEELAFCWGNIVKLGWILTNAACVHNQDIKKFSAIAGSRIIFDESNRQNRKCNRRYIPTKYEQYLSVNDESRFLYNFALVELTEPFEMKAGVKPINILRETIPDLNGVQVDAYSWIEKKYRDAQYAQLARDTVKIENQDVEGIKMLMLTVPLAHRIVIAYGYGVAYRGQLLGITGRRIGESHTIIAMQNGLLDFIDANIPNFAPKP